MADPKKKEEVHALTYEDAFRSDKKDWEYVTVPEFTILGTVQDSIGLNYRDFGPGKHFVPPMVAAEIRERLAADHDQKLRINSDQRRLEAIRKTRGAIDMPVDGI